MTSYFHYHRFFHAPIYFPSAIIIFFLYGIESVFLLGFFHFILSFQGALFQEIVQTQMPKKKQTEKHHVQTVYLLLCVCALSCSKVVPTISSSNLFRALHLDLYINCILVLICCNNEGCERMLENYLRKKEMAQ